MTIAQADVFVSFMQSPSTPAILGKKMPTRERYLGIDDLDITTVELTEFDFDETDTLNVASTGERHLELLNHTADRVVVPPIADNAPDSKRISSRGGMFIPHLLVPYVLGKRLNAKQAFVVLFPVIQHMGLEQVCAPLVDFLMAAGSQHKADEETHHVL